MKLIELKFLPRGTEGWSSPPLRFAEEVTLLFARNGSGKTPVVQAIVYGLGFPVTFREDVAAKCEAIQLTVEIRGIELVIYRPIDKEFFVKIDEKGVTHELFSERAFSNFIFERIGLAPSVLVSTGRQAASPYLSTILPLFYLDQDVGYSSLYKAPAQFILDQYSEMVRFVFGLSPKNSFNSKKDLIEFKSRLELLDKRIIGQKQLVEKLAADLADKNKEPKELDEEISNVKQQLQSLRSSRDTSATVRSMLDEQYHQAEEALKDTARQIAELDVRINGMEKIRAEIETETATLSLNEEARRLFDSFKDICDREDCRLFLGSSESYAKNLLYLKDQVKDMERNTSVASIRRTFFLERQSQQQTALDSIEQQRNKNSEQDEIAGLVDLIGRLTEQLFDLERERKALEIYRAQISTHYDSLLERDSLQDQIALVDKAGSDGDLRFIALRMELKSLAVRWLDILATKNVSRNIEIQPDLKMLFGGESFDPIKGSTKTRIVLAVHAAMLELYLKETDREFRFLILDTPRQHEIHQDDLNSFFVELKKLAAEKQAQIIFSSTEYHYAGNERDTEWVPQYPGREQSMYLG